MNNFISKIVKMLSSTVLKGICKSFIASVVTRKSILKDKSEVTPGAKNLEVFLAVRSTDNLVIHIEVH